MHSPAPPSLEAIGTWSSAWAEARLVPIDAGFAVSLLAHGLPMLDRDLERLLDDWAQARREPAANQLGRIFELYFPISLSWLAIHDRPSGSSDSRLRGRYFLFRLLLDRLRHLGLPLEASRDLVDGYLAQAPVSNAARLVLAELHLESGHWEIAIGLVKRLLSTVCTQLLPQKVLAAMLRTRHSPQETPLVEGVYIGDLSDRFCAIPFDEMMTDWEGQVWTCCPSFLPVAIGNIYRDPWDRIWQSETARELRRSILDGDFSHCSRTQCPMILSGTLPRRTDLTEARIQDLVESRDRDQAPPIKFYFCHDASCNLTCPQCRTELYKLAPEQAARLERAMTTLVEPVLEHAATHPATILLSGNGDPFASEHYLAILKRFDPARHALVTLNLVSNGLLFKLHWDRLPNIHPLLIQGSVSFSLDGASPEVYKLTRGASWAKALENLQFLAGLHREGRIGSIGINYAVQECNFRDMSRIMELAIELGFDTVGFNQLRNEGTYPVEDYRRRAIFVESHPRYPEFLEELRHPALRSPIASFGSLTAHFRLANPEA